jgi:hypothetical protein
MTKVLLGGSGYKTIGFVFILFFVPAGLMSACNENDDPKTTPTISFSAHPGSGFFTATAKVKNSAGSAESSICVDAEPLLDCH